MGDDDGGLVARAKHGDREAFADLVRRHHPAVGVLCRGMLRDAAAADDAAQEAFLAAWRSLASYKGDAAFATWLHRIAANKCLDALRRSGRRGEESLDALLESAAGPAFEPKGRGPEAAVEAADLAAKVLDALPAEQRLALVLREEQGLSYEEIMAVMGCSLDSVKARLQRARSAALKALRHFSGEGASNG